MNWTELRKEYFNQNVDFRVLLKKYFASLAESHRDNEKTKEQIVSEIVANDYSNQNLEEGDYDDSLFMVNSHDNPDTNKFLTEIFEQCWQIQQDHNYDNFDDMIMVFQHFGEDSIRPVYGVMIYFDEPSKTLSALVTKEKTGWKVVTSSEEKRVWVLSKITHLEKDNKSPVDISDIKRCFTHEFSLRAVLVTTRHTYQP